MDDITTTATRCLEGGRRCVYRPGHAGPHQDGRGRLWLIAAPGDPYVEVADANPERVNNGCQIYKAN